MKKNFIDFIHQHSATGVWTGASVDGVGVVKYQGQVQPVEPFLKQLGIKLTKTTKYTVRQDDAGMGESHAGGNTSDAGDGVSQEQE